MPKQDHYTILGISPTANQDEISNAYRRQARKWHPDVNKDPGATAKMQEINEANAILPIPRSGPSTTNSEELTEAAHRKSHPAEGDRVGMARPLVAAKEEAPDLLEQVLAIATEGVRIVRETPAAGGGPAEVIKRLTKEAVLLENRGEAMPVPRRRAKVRIQGKNASSRGVQRNRVRLNGTSNSVRITGARGCSFSRIVRTGSGIWSSGLMRVGSENRRLSGCNRNV